MDFTFCVHSTDGYCQIEKLFIILKFNSILQHSIIIQLQIELDRVPIKKIEKKKKATISFRGFPVFYHLILFLFLLELLCCSSLGHLMTIFNRKYFMCTSDKIFDLTFKALMKPCLTWYGHVRKASCCINQVYPRSSWTGNTKESLIRVCQE